MTLSKRIINIQFQLGKGSFGENGEDTISLTGLRVSAAITKTGGVSMSELNMRVFGLSLDVMNKLTILGKPLLDARLNKITISAGDEDGGVAVAYIGNITEAWVDTGNAPDVSFVVVAHTGLMDAMKPVPPTSYKGSVDAAVVMNGIAAQMSPPRPLENSGVSVQISNPYLPGTLREQAIEIARAGQFNLLIDDVVVAIWPKDKSRGGDKPLLSPETGLVGYPTRTQNGIQLVTLFNPAIVFGGEVEVRSSLTPANGIWSVFSVTHEIEAEKPNGKWFTTMECSILGQSLAIAG